MFATVMYLASHHVFDDKKSEVDTLRNKEISKMKGEIILKILVLELRILSYMTWLIIRNIYLQSEANPSKNK